MSEEKTGLRHPLVVGIITALLAALMGQTISYQYQMTKWEKQKNYELFKENISGGQRMMEKMVDLMSKRLFYMQKIVWVATGEDDEELKNTWDEYYIHVTNWNTAIYNMKIHLKQFAKDDQLVQDFYNDADNMKALYKNDPVTTLHAKMLRTHKRLKKLYVCVQNDCPEEARSKLSKEASTDINDLAKKIESFSNKSLTTIEQASLSYLE